MNCKLYSRFFYMENPQPNGCGLPLVGGLKIIDYLDF